MTIKVGRERNKIYCSPFISNMILQSLGQGHSPALCLGIIPRLQCSNSIQAEEVNPAGLRRWTSAFRALKVAGIANGTRMDASVWRVATEICWWIHPVHIGLPREWLLQAWTWNRATRGSCVGGPVEIQSSKSEETCLTHFNILGIQMRYNIFWEFTPKKVSLSKNSTVRKLLLTRIDKA